MHKKILLAFLFTFSFSALIGQAAYEVAVSNTKYTNLPADATSVPIDSINKYIDLPFSFKVGKEPINKLFFDYNAEYWGLAGVEKEGQKTIQYMIPLNSDATVYYSDLNNPKDVGIYYTTEGAEGERIFKIEWKNIPTFDDPKTNISFQTWLYEKDNTIKYIIGDVKNPKDGIFKIRTLIGIFNNHTGSSVGEESFLLTGDAANPTIETGISLSHDNTPSALKDVPKTGTVYTITYKKSSSTQNIEQGDIDVAIYPNPATDFISVSMAKQGHIESVNIRSIDGKKIVTAHDSFHRIDVSQISSGNYIIEVVSDRGSKMKKFVIR